jgi:acetyltransferase
VIENAEIWLGTRSLELFFRPKSIAMVGATDDEGSAGQIVLGNLIQQDDKRRIYPLNPKRKSIMGNKCYPGISDLPETPDLVVIVTPAETVQGIVEECGKINNKAVIIISSGFKEIGEEGEIRERSIAEIAKKHQIRIIGPNCMGIIRPSASLNTSFIRKMPDPGKVAFLSQSGALGAGILDWAIRRNLGFSAFVSLGSMLDVDFGDAIDFFGEDPETRSIIIYPESLGNVKRFMSAARGFARSKPIVVLKPGRFQETARALHSHTGAMVGEDLHYDAIFHRAGVVRVEEMRDLFNSASILDIAKLPTGPKVAIITNGGGPGVLAIDKLISSGGKLATLSNATLSKLDEFLPSNWSKSNPIDIREDATTQRYIDAIEITVQDPAVNGLIVIFSPQGRARSMELAKAVIKQTEKTGKPILNVWIGADTVADARQLFHDNKVSAFEFPEDAIKTYLYMWQYSRNLDMLYQTPEESPLAGASRNHLKTLIRRTVREGRTFLTQEDTFRFLSTYRIPTTTAVLGTTAEEAVVLASRIGYPVVLKIASPDIYHKSDVKGVVCGVNSETDVRKAFDEIVQNIKTLKPDARIDGVSIHNMITQYDYELIVGVKKDPICGPVIMFGLGGKDTELIRDFAVGLPPLNHVLARRILEQTRVYERLSGGYRDRIPVNLRQLDDILVRVSDLIADFPEIMELDINPIVIRGESAIALDAKILLDTEAIKGGTAEYGHLIISPYPTRYVTLWQTKDGRSVILRPIKPDDEAMEKKAIEKLTEESQRFRFFSILHKVTHEMLVRFCNIDYDREMTITAEYAEKGEKRSVGNSRLLIQSDGLSGEFAVLVAEDFRNIGLGLKLTDMIIGIARDKGLKSIYGIALKENSRMISLARRLGFTIENNGGEEVKFTLEL